MRFGARRGTLRLMFQNPQAEAAVILANERFYRAFSDGDFLAMSELWAHRVQVACFHPTAPALIGREAVLQSFRQILRGAPTFALRCDEAVVTVVNDTAILTCYEGAGEDPAHLAATNVFVVEDGNWRMVHHHAGPLSRPIRRTAPPVVH
jgi:ketosteroid isomerase-like protein